MMDSNLAEKIEAYLSGEMNREEAIQFSEEIDNNAELREQYNLYKQVQETMQLSVRNTMNEQAIRQTISSIGKEIITPQKSKTIAFKRSVWFAAAAAVIVLFVSYFLLTDREPQTAALYAQYAIHEPLSVVRGSNDSIITEAIYFYNHHQYTQAKPLLQTCLSADTINKELQLALHICELETGDLTHSLTGFRQIAATQNVYTYQAVWYEALIYLKQGNKALCKSLLATIPKDADTYLKAQELLQKL